MLESSAWRVVSLSGRRVLDRVEIELSNHRGNDNGRLPVTFDNFEEFGIDRHAIAPAMREVIALGFLEITERGRAGNAEWRKPNLFRLTYRHVGKAEPTNEWERIKEVRDARKIVRTIRPRTKSQCGAVPNFSGGDPHRKDQIHTGETPTTCHSGETPTTSKHLRGGAAADRLGGGGSRFDQWSKTTETMHVWVPSCSVSDD